MKLAATTANNSPAMLASTPMRSQRTSRLCRIAAR